jgi:membrane-associated phospholipid phosphatase
MADATGTTSVKGAVEQADIAAVETLRPAFESSPAQALGELGKLGDEPPLAMFSAAVLVAGVLAGRSSLWRAGVRMLAAHAVATGLKNLVKNSVDRTRPQLLDHGEYRMEPGHSKDKRLRSFPSGHAAGVSAVARAASRELRLGPGLSLAAASLASMQIVRRMHFPSDVIAGAALGLLAEAIAGRLLQPLLGPARRG